MTSTSRFMSIMFASLSPSLHYMRLAFALVDHRRVELADHARLYAAARWRPIGRRGFGGSVLRGVDDRGFLLSHFVLPCPGRPGGPPSLQPKCIQVLVSGAPPTATSRMSLMRPDSRSLIQGSGSLVHAACTTSVPTAISGPPTHDSWFLPHGSADTPAT